MIKIKNLSYAFKERQVLSHVNLHVKEGTILCLLGPNGCGKTSLLNCITSYYGGYTGEILINGLDTKNLNHKQRAMKISYVPQLAKESFPFRVFDIVLMGRTPYTGTFRSPGKQDEKVVWKVLEDMKIESLANRPFNQLSGGESQLVKLARGLAQEAQIHILDEPTAALDLKNELQLLETITDLVNHKNNTVVMATHYPNQPLYFENKGLKVMVCLLDEGKVKYYGKASEVIHYKSIKEVYGVDAHIDEYSTELGHKGKVVIPIKTY